MIEIFVYIFHTYTDYAAQPAPEALASKLKAAGFPQAEVQAALQWLADLRSATDQAALPLVDPRAQRVYAASEIEQLGVDGIAFLGFLERNRILDARLRELVIERAAAFVA